MAAISDTHAASVSSQGDGRSYAAPQWHVREWKIEPETNRIVGPDKTTRVEPKVMDVLVCFLERPNETLSQDYLMDAVWGDIIVEDNALRRVVSQLRKVFRDNPRQPEFIETIPKKGYRFIAPVAYRADVPILQPPGVPAPVAARLPVPKKRPAWYVLLGWVGAAVAVSAIGIGAVVQLRSSDTVQPLPKRPLTTLPGVEAQPRLSPDGQHVAFVASGGEGQPDDVFIQSLSGDAPIQLTQTPEREVSPVWSPDGNSILFSQYGTGRCGIFEVPALGGTPLKRSDCLPFMNGFLDWSPDGTLFAVSGRQEGENISRIYLIDAATGEVQALTTPPASSGGDLKPLFSPDGNHIAFVRRVTGPLDDLFVIPTTGGAVRQLTHDGASTAGHSWNAAGDALLFSSNRGGNYRLWSVPFAGGEPRWMAGVGAYDPGMPAIAAAGTHMVYEEWLFDFNIWRWDLAGGGEPGEGTRVIGSTQWDAHPQLSPDGQRIAFTSNRTGGNELWTSDAQGNHLLRLTQFDGAYVSNPSWSPNGQYLAFEVRREAQADVYLIDAQGGALRQLTTAPGDEVVPRWSHDGEHIYFGSARSGTWEIWQLPVTGGTPTQVTTSGGYAAQEVDGFVYFSKNGVNGLWRQPVAGGSAEEVFANLYRGDWGNWVVHEEGLYFMARARDGDAVAYYDFATEAVEIRVRPDKPVYDYKVSFSLAPDASYVLLTQTDQRETDLMLVEEMP